MKTPSDEIFLLDGEQLNPLPARSMKAGLFGKNLEDALQTMLQRYPQVIPGKQIDMVSEDPPRFALLRREVPIAAWSLDHLYIDRYGVLTLVETKLFQNPESRREVIGQILEYTANALHSWAQGRARQHGTEFWSQQGREMDDVLQEQLGQEIDTEDLWNNVEANLKTGRIRLIIATDELRPELRRVIEYLNKEMQNAEVFGLELKCYGDDKKTLVLVPHLVGKSQDRPEPPDGVSKIWTANKLREAYSNLPNHELGQTLLKVLDWALSNKIFQDARAQNPTFAVRGKNRLRIFSFFANGRISLFVSPRHYADGEKQRDQLLDEVKNLQLIDQDLNPQEIISGRDLNVLLSELDQDRLDKLLTVLKKYCV